MDKEQYLTVQEACQELGLAETTIRTSLSKCRLPFIVMYGRKLIARFDLDIYKQRTQPDGVKKVGRPRKKDTGQRIFK